MFFSILYFRFPSRYRLVKLTFLTYHSYPFQKSQQVVLLLAFVGVIGFEPMTFCL